MKKWWNGVYACVVVGVLGGCWKRSYRLLYINIYLYIYFFYIISGVNKLILIMICIDYKL